LGVCPVEGLKNIKSNLNGGPHINTLKVPIMDTGDPKYTD